KQNNSKADLNVLPSLKDCKIIGEILKRHLLKDNLSLFAPSPFIYMQKLCYTISRASDAKYVIRFKIDQQEVDFTLANFCSALRLPIPTSGKPFDQPFEFLIIARSLRNDLSSDKATFLELTDNLDTISEVLRRSDLPGILKKIDDALYVVVPKISIDANNVHLKDNLINIISQELATRVPKTIE
nr:hypothetical protein [Tanacetum cinerariifolium]GFA55165.1 hypothetical protein [Tanacetum cinerariifolium]